MDYHPRFGRRARYYRRRLNRFFSSFGFSQDTYLLILGSITGILCGFGAVIFHSAIEFIKTLFFDFPGHLFGQNSLIGFHTWYGIALIILVPAVGGLLVGLLTHYFEDSRKGEGIPTVIDAVARKGGIIKGRVAILKTLGAGLSIGTGGAGGREGPIVQIGSSIGSAFGQYLNTSQDRLKILVGCGAAAGLSAAFNAPLGGALFAMEIILRTFNARSFSPIIIASVFGTVISRTFIGDEPAFKIPAFQLVNNIEFIFYTALGLLAAGTSVYFVRVFLKIDEFFDRMQKLPYYLKPALGGLAVGVIGVYLPGVYGFTYASIDSSLYNNATFIVLLLLLIFKPIATGLTIGSGGNGGTFAPSLFTGAMLGGCFGQIVNYLFPQYSGSPGAYALVGMGAVVAGTTHASLTALIMVFEITNNYKIILPLMLAIIISTTVSKAILKGSLYTLKFDREGKGIDIYGRNLSVMKKLKVVDLVEAKTDFVNENFIFKQILEVLKVSRFNTVLVVNHEGKISGKISFEDIRNAIIDEESRNILNFLVAGDLMVKSFKSIRIDRSGEEALQIMEKDDLEYLPVFNLDNEFAGIITKENILKKYQNELFLWQSESDLAIR